MEIKNFGATVYQLKLQTESKTSANQEVPSTGALEPSAKKQPFGQAVSAAAHAKNEARKSMSAYKDEFNAHLLEMSAEVSLRAGNEPLSVVFSTAIAALNAELGEVTGKENPLQAAVDEGLDVSPEATAQRIVSMSTKLFAAYLENNPNPDEDQAKAAFIDIIRAGIEKGFEEARSVLDGLQVLQGDIAGNVDKTYSLVQQGLDAFLAATDEEMNTDKLEQPVI
jgi:hypothetical protein